MRSSTTPRSYAVSGASESGIKRVLLNQSLISGVGNIYADEGLWLARVHGERPGSRLRKSDVERVLSGCRQVMLEALGEGGTSFDSLYVNVNGESGYFDRSLKVYGREAEPCSRCGTPIRRVHFHEPLLVLLPGLPTGPFLLLSLRRPGPSPLINPKPRPPAPRTAEPSQKCRYPCTSANGSAVLGAFL